MLVASGEIREKDIRHHEDRNRLLRVMGIPWRKKTYEIAPPIPFDENQAFLLCSDGFWEYIEEAEMAAFLARSATPSGWNAWSRKCRKTASERIWTIIPPSGCLREERDSRKNGLNSGNKGEQL